MASPTSRQTLIDFCRRRLGEPVIEINIDDDQVEDKVDDAIQMYQEFHSDATYRTYVKHQITQTDIDNEYIPVSSDILYISNVFPINPLFSDADMFDIRYQMALQSMQEFTMFTGGMSYYFQMQQYLEFLWIRFLTVILEPLGVDTKTVSTSLVSGHRTLSITLV